MNVSGELAGIDPNKPRIPQYGRRLYKMGLRKFFNEAHQEHIPLRVVSRSRVACGIPFGTGSRESIVVTEVIQEHLNRYLEDLTRTRYQAVVLDYDGTLCEPDKREEPPSKELIKEILRLLDMGIIVGIATGRGKSVRVALRPLIPRDRWPQVVIAYYNGADIGHLGEDRPDRSAEIHPTLGEFAELIEKSSVLRHIAHWEIRPCQITLEPRMLCSLELLYQALVELNPRLGDEGITIAKSGHSLDVLAPGVSKLNLLDHIRSTLNAKGAMTPILCIGDKGAWPGNDFDILQEKHSLSVDESPIGPLSGWNVAPIGHRRTQAALDYIRAMTVEDGFIRLNVDKRWLIK